MSSIFLCDEKLFSSSSCLRMANIPPILVYKSVDYNNKRLVLTNRKTLLFHGENYSHQFLFGFLWMKLLHILGLHHFWCFAYHYTFKVSIFLIISSKITKNYKFLLILLFHRCFCCKCSKQWFDIRDSTYSRVFRTCSCRIIIGLLSKSRDIHQVIRKLNINTDWRVSILYSSK